MDNQHPDIAFVDLNPTLLTPAYCIAEISLSCHCDPQPLLPDVTRQVRLRKLRFKRTGQAFPRLATTRPAERGLILFGEAEFLQFLDHVPPMSGRIYLAIDVLDDPILVDVEGPAAGKVSIFVQDAVGGRHFLPGSLSNG